MKFLIFASAVLAAALSVAFYHKYKYLCNSVGQRFTYWHIDADKSSKSEKIDNIFAALGFTKVDGSVEKWNIVWSSEYPYDYYPEHLERSFSRRQQKINHFPGITYMTNKMALSTTIISKYIPAAFSFPKDRQKYQNFALTDAKNMFLLKNDVTGGVRLIRPDSIDSISMKNRFVQVLVRDPFLIANRAFDLGIFVAITSLEPLTIYKFNSDCLIRLCPEPYYPFAPSNTRKYVSSQESLGLKDIEAFGELTGNFTDLKIFEAYYKSKGKSADSLWEQIDDAIVQTTVSNADLMVSEMSNQCEVYGCTNSNFFELLRFDFVVDRAGDVRLIDVNMSPDLGASGNYLEQIILNVLRLIGAEELKDLRNISPMTSRLENLAVDIENCGKCAGKCSEFSCSHCLTCMSKEFHEVLHKTHREHQRRGEFRRIFPSSAYEGDSETNERLSEQTKLLSRWFEKKCADDDDWC